MSLNENERNIIVTRELEKTQRTFSDAVFCASEGKWEAAANRIYYALFHAMSALLVSDGHQVKSHRGSFLCLVSTTSKQKSSQDKTVPCFLI